MPLTDRMPTTAKIVAAIGLAIVAWFASEKIRPLMPPDTNFGWFNQVNMVLGILCGWVVIGSRAGRSYSEAISSGLTGMGALVFWGLFLQSFNEMLKLALDRRYDGPVEAITSIFAIAVDFGTYLLNGPLIMLLVGGSIAVGLVTEWASRRWS